MRWKIHGLESNPVFKIINDNDFKGYLKKCFTCNTLKKHYTTFHILIQNNSGNLTTQS